MSEENQDGVVPQLPPPPPTQPEVVTDAVLKPVSPEPEPEEFAAEDKPEKKSVFSEPRQDFQEVFPFRARKMLRIQFGEKFDAEQAEGYGPDFKVYNQEPMDVYVSELNIRGISQVTTLVKGIVAKLSEIGFFDKSEDQDNAKLVSGLFDVIADSINDVFQILEVSCFKDPARQERFTEIDFDEWSVSMAADCLHAVWDVNYHYGTSLKKLLGGLFATR